MRCDAIPSTLHATIPAAGAGRLALSRLRLFRCPRPRRHSTQRTPTIRVREPSHDRCKPAAAAVAAAYRCLVAALVTFEPANTAQRARSGGADPPAPPLVTMLSLLLTLTLLLRMAPDFTSSMYSSATQIHARVNEAAERNSGAAAARRFGIAFDDAGGDTAAAAAAVAGGYKSWMRASWAREAGASASSPITNIQLLEASNPHVAGPATVALSLTLPEAVPAAELLPLLLDTSTHATTTAETGGPVPLRALFNFGEHGRELISSEIALRIVRMLDIARNEELRQTQITGGGGSGGSSGGGDGTATTATAVAPELDPLFSAFLLSHVSLTLLPLLNVWSHERVEQGFVCERKNARGTDLNRNWDYMWGQDPHPFLPDDEQFPGASAFSELESRVLRDVATALRPDLYVNYHSGIREMYCGWDHRTQLVPNAIEVMKLLNYANDRHCQCAIGGAGAIGGYVVFGGSMDYLYDRLRVPYSLTVEVFGGAAGVPPSDCYAYFNPTTPALLETTTAEWARLSIDSMYFLLREKKGLVYPFRLDEFLQQQPRAGAQGVQATVSSTPNFYSRMEEIVARLNALSASYAPVPSALSVSPFLAYAETPSAADTAAAATDADPGEPRPDWNNACTPFLVSLPAGVTARIEQPESLLHLLPLWRELDPTLTPTPASGAAAGTDSSDEALRVLVVGGALWNDLITTEMVCSWLETAAASAQSSSSRRLKLWIIPSLFAHARLRLLEVPALHPSFCSASLSPDSEVTLLSHQLYSMQQLLRVLRDEIRPRVVIEVTAEEFVHRNGAGSAASFMHVEATSVAPASGDNDDEKAASADEPGAELLRLFSALMSDSSVAASAARTSLSWSVRSRTQALLDASVLDPLQCRVGLIDVARLLLPPPGTTAPDEAPRCPSCRLLLKLYVHGSRADVAPVTAATNLVEADAAEMAALAAAQADWTARLASDRVPPSSYRKSEREGSGGASSDRTAPSTRKGLRSMVMAETRMEMALRARRTAAVSSSSSSPSPLSSGQPPLHWCDFASRNLEAHTVGRVLALHVEQSAAVWNLLRGVLESMPTTGAAWGMPSSGADSAPPAPFAPPTFVQVASAEVPAHGRPLPADHTPSRSALRLGGGANAWELFGLTMLLMLALCSLIAASVTLCCKRRRYFSRLPPPPVSPTPSPGRTPISSDQSDGEIEMHAV